jgi:O-antigen/teichoic acid export membrane protein
MRRQLSVWRTSTAARATLGSLGVAVVSQAALLVSGILVARALTPTDRGYLALIGLVGASVALLGSMGVTQAVIQFISKDPETAGSIVRTVRTVRRSQLVGSAIVFAAILAVLLEFDKLPTYAIAAAVLSVAALPATLGFEYGLAVLLGQQRFGESNLLRPIPQVAYVLLLGGLVLTVEVTLTSIAAVLCASAAFSTALVMVRARLRLGQKETGTTLREILRFGRQSWVGLISPLESFRLDQLYLGLTLPAAALGQYLVGGAFANLGLFVATSIAGVAAPLIAAEPDPALQDRRIRQFVGLTSVICGALTLGLLAIMGVLVPALFGPKFAPAVEIGRILVVASFFLAVRRVMTETLRARGYPRLGTYGELAALTIFGALLFGLPGQITANVVAAAFAVAAACAVAVMGGLYLLLVRGRPDPTGAAGV